MLGHPGGDPEATMIRNSKMGRRALALLTTMTVAGGQALAQEGGGPQSKAADKSAPAAIQETLQYVVVTARKREDLSQNVPSAITAVTGRPARTARGYATIRSRG